MPAPGPAQRPGPTQLRHPTTRIGTSYAAGWAFPPERPHVPQRRRLLVVAPLSIDLSPESHWPGFDEGLREGVPPAGVLDERDGDRVLNAASSFAKRNVDKNQKPVQDVALPCAKRLEGEPQEVSGEQVQKQSVVVRQMLGHQELALRHVLPECPEEVRRCHRHVAIMPNTTPSYAEERKSLQAPRIGLTQPPKRAWPLPTRDGPWGSCRAAQIAAVAAWNELGAPMAQSPAVWSIRKLSSSSYASRAVVADLSDAQLSHVRSAVEGDRARRPALNLPACVGVGGQFAAWRCVCNAQDR